MNKELLELLDSINEKKALVKNLVDEGKIEEAKTAKAELKEMQDKFDILKDMDDTEPAPKNPKPVKPIVEDDAVKKFINAARFGFRNIMTSTEKKDGGYTVPADLDTEINQFKDASFNLDSLVTIEPVSTPSGSRVFQKKGHSAGFAEVGENGKIQAMDQPEFLTMSYNIKKYAGYLPVTNELLDDSDAAIRSVITKWIGDGSRVTHNKLILEALADGKTAEAADAPTYTVIKGIDDITKIINVTLGAAYKAGAKIITNDNGLQVLCELKDGNGRPMLNPNPADPAKMQLAAGPVVIPVEVLPTADFPNVTDKGKNHPPFVIGDLKEAVTFFDRKHRTISSSDTASVTGYNAFEQDGVLFKCIEREDVEIKDAAAYAYCYFSATVSA